jgi:hypothetical protein
LTPKCWSRPAGKPPTFLADKWNLLREICIVSGLRQVERFEGRRDGRRAGRECSGLNIAVLPAAGSQMRALLDH